MAKVLEYNGMEVEVILGSVSRYTLPIWTIRTRHPRPIHSEWMTHRQFSRNAGSSRAKPIEKVIADLQAGRGFIPWHWGKNQSGMQAGENWNAMVGGEGVSGYDHLDNDYDGISKEEAWQRAMEKAIQFAEAFHKAKYHKQIVGRLLEPFTFIDCLTTSVHWKNFFALRDHKDAEPHFRDLAQMVKEAVQDYECQWLETGEWHFPYANREQDVWDAKTFLRENEGLKATPDEVTTLLRKMSPARCARISYNPFDMDKADVAKDLSLYEQLAGWPVHASPMEHQATPDNRLGMVSRLPGHLEYIYEKPKLHGNLTGYIQNRQLIEGHDVKDW